MRTRITRLGETTRRLVAVAVIASATVACGPRPDDTGVDPPFSPSRRPRLPRPDPTR